MVAISHQLSRSYALTVIFEYFDIEDAIKFQVLNKNMYLYKTPMMCFSIAGRRIEREVMIYDVYTNSKNKLSVIIGEIPPPGDDLTIDDKIQAYLKKFPMFASKFQYENFNWPCFENKKLLVAVFSFRHPNFRIRLSENQTFYNNK